MRQATYMPGMNSPQPRSRDVGRPGHPTHFASPSKSTPEVGVAASWTDRVATYGLQQLAPTPPPPDDKEWDGYWPPPPAVTKHKLTGELARRVMARMRMEGARGRVAHLTESTFFGGTSEWTAEQDIEFEVTMGDKRFSFTPDSTSVEGWLDGQNQRWQKEDSVFARFHDWLRAGDDPEGLWDEWFPHPPEENEWWVSYDLADDTTLTRFLRRWVGKQFDHAALVLEPKDRLAARRNAVKLAAAETYWRLDVVLAENERGFREIRESFHVTPGPTHPTGRVEVPRVEVLRMLTNRLRDSGR